jgi:hypothetical protein
VGLNDRDYDAIFEEIRRGIPPHEVTYGKVVKRDVTKKLVWLKEYGDQAIPIVGLRHIVTYYDTTPTGVDKKTALIEPEVPKVGELVVVLRQMGSRRLPKCLGPVLSRAGSYVG